MFAFNTGHIIIQKITEISNQIKSNQLYFSHTQSYKVQCILKCIVGLSPPGTCTLQ